MAKRSTVFGCRANPLEVLVSHAKSTYRGSSGTLVLGDQGLALLERGTPVGRQPLNWTRQALRHL